jgi:HEAT repeat protein
MGAAAKAAIPALEQAAVNDDDESVRAAAKFALNSIRK